MSERKQPRMYEPAWLQLKKNLTLVLDAPPAYHQRIREAIYKEKKLDLALRLENATTGGITRLKVSSAGRRLSFKLVYVL